MLDAKPYEGGMGGLGPIEGKPPHEGPAAIKGMQLKNGVKHTLRWSVRGSGIQMTLDGKTLIDYQGGYAKLDGPRAKNGWPLFVEVHNKASYRIHSLRLTPLAGVSSPESGWMSLFNGKDLDGWEKPGPNSGWTVEDGMLVGRRSHQYLNSTRGDFANFHLRAEAKVNAEGSGNLFFRAEKGGFAPGFSAAISGLPLAKGETRTNILRHNKSTATWLASAKPDLVKPDEWFKIEVIAIDKEIIVKINDVIVADAFGSTPASGRIALGTGFETRSVIHFKKIEIKELPATTPPEQGFAPLFNSKNLHGWNVANSMDGR